MSCVYLERYAESNVILDRCACDGDGRAESNVEMAM